MIHTKLTPITRQVTLLASTILFCANNVLGLDGDPFSFCTNTCKSPGLCSTEANKIQCKKVCLDKWKQVAELQMSNNRGFQAEKDESKKEEMLYNSPLAKCLELAPKGKEAAPLPSPASPPPAPTPMKVTAPKEDLCAAALKNAMADFEGDKIALDHGKIILESQKNELAATLKVHEAR